MFGIKENAKQCIVGRHTDLKLCRGMIGYIGVSAVGEVS